MLSGQSKGRAGCDGRQRRGQYGEGGHAHREKTRPAHLGDTVPETGASPHRPKGWQKYRFRPERRTKRAGTP